LGVLLTGINSIFAKNMDMKEIYFYGDGHYYVDKLGIVYSDRRGGLVALGGSINHNGYLKVVLSNDSGGRKSFFVHRLVCSIFLDNPNNYAQVNHKNFIKTDNRVENLEWVSAIMNINHAVIHGKNRRRGADVVTAKLTEEDVRAIRKRLLSESYKSVFKDYKHVINWDAFRNVCRRNSWQHISV
jgi:hypothetical protein